MSIHVELATDDPVTPYTYGPPPAELTFTCTRYRSSVLGGPIDAVVEVTGPEHVLWTALEWLRRPVTLRNGAGQRVWWGYVQEVELQIGARKVGRSLDNMANRVRIAYAQEGAGASYARQTTTALDDALSQAQYGVKELLHSMGEATPARAAAKAAEVLANSKQPPALQTFGGGAGIATATLFCAGWIETLKWRTYQRVGSRVTFEGQASGAAQAIGWYLASTDIYFTRNAGIHDLYARLGALATGSRIYVTGSAYAGNNNEYTVTRPTSDARVVYTANTIFFASDDDIYDNAQGFSFVRNNALIRFSGTAQNSGVREIDGVQTTGYITTSHLAGQIAPEGVGPTITMEQGHEIGVTPVPANSLAASGTKTITLYGYRMAQSFVSTFAGEVGQIGVMAGKVGSPVDALRVSLCADNSGQPGTVIQSTEIAGSDLGEGTAWVWLDFATRPTIASGVTYWLLVERSGANDPTDYYEVGMTATASGVCLAYTGTAWIANPTGSYLPHQVWQAEETTAQLEQIVASVGQFVDGVTIEAASGIWDNPERSGDKSAYDEVLKLVEAGQSSGNRLLLTLDANRVLRVYAKPSRPGEQDAPDIYTLNGYVVTAAGGQRRAEGDLPVGEWLAIEKTPRHLGLSPLFVDEAEYNAERGTTTITPEYSK